MNWVTSDDPKFTDAQQLAKDILELIGHGHVSWVSTLEEKGQYEIALGGLDRISSVTFEVGWLELEKVRIGNTYDAYVLHCATRILGVSPKSKEYKNRLVTLYSTRLAEIEMLLTALQNEKTVLQNKRENIKPYQTDDQP